MEKNKNDSMLPERLDASSDQLQAEVVEWMIVPSRDAGETINMNEVTRASKIEHKEKNSKILSPLLANSNSFAETQQKRMKQKNKRSRVAGHSSMEKHEDLLTEQ